MGCLSYYSHAAVNALRMKEIVEEHRQKWIEYHEVRELKRQIDSAGLWGKPSEVMNITIYRPELYAKAMRMHEEELQHEIDQEERR